MNVVVIISPTFARVRLQALKTLGGALKRHFGVKLWTLDRIVVPEAGILVAATEDAELVLDGSGERPLPGAALRPGVLDAKRFGIVHVDFDTQKRTIKDSGYWYKETIRTNGSEI